MRREREGPQHIKYLVVLEDCTKILYRVKALHNTSIFSWNFQSADPAEAAGHVAQGPPGEP